MKPRTSAACYVGRIGASAVALGIGAAITLGHGVAWAEPSTGSSSPGSSSSSSESGASSGVSTGSSTGKRADTTDRTPAPSRAQESDDDAAEKAAADGVETGGSRGVTRGESGADDDGEAAARHVAPATPPTAASTNTKRRTSTAATSGAATSTASQATPTPRTEATHQVAEKQAARTPSAAGGPTASPATTGTKDAPPAAAATVQRALTDQGTAATAATTATTSATTATTMATTPTPSAPAESAAATVATTLLAAAGLAPLSGGVPSAPTPNPSLLALMAFARRETERTSTSGAESTPLAQSSTLAAAATTTAANISALASTPLGWVTGQDNAKFLAGYPVPQTNNTAGFDIYGTDLGIMWDGGTIDGKRFVHLAFGDTFSQPGMTGNWRNNVLLISYDTNFYKNALNQDKVGLELAPTGPAFQFIDRSTTELSFLFPNEVTVIPTAGTQINGTQYVNYMSVRSWDTPGRWTTNYSAISQFYPGEGGGDWRVVPSTIRSAGWFRSSTPYVAGNQNFQQFAYVLQPEDQVGEDGVRYLYAFGTPSGRAGSAYLSRVPEGAITDLSKYEYWDGSGWVVGRPAAAVPVIGDSNRSAGLFGFVVDFANDPNVLGGYLGGLFGAKTGGNVSEMSVQYNEYLDQYVVLYADGNNDIQMRTASQPQGPWSSPITVARSADYPGLYAPMIHPWSGTGLLTGRDGQPDVSTLYWNMSLWGDYNVVLMETDLSPLTAEQV